jgi:hypothetical protein
LHNQAFYLEGERASLSPATGSGESYVVPPMADADNLQRANEGEEGWRERARVPRADYVK